MTAADIALLEAATIHDDVVGVLDARTLEVLDRRRRTARVQNRGWLIRRMLVVADVLGLVIAFLVASWAFAGTGQLLPPLELLVFAATLPGWVVLAKLYGLYDQDEERTDHSTVNEVFGVFHLVTVGTAAVYATAVVFGDDPRFARFGVFWAVAVGAVALARAKARAVSRRQIAYVQNTIIVGAGDVGQLIARKFLHHPEYGINVVGFVDSSPKERRADLRHLTVLGPTERLNALVTLLDIERVIVAFSQESHTETLEIVRSLGNLGVQVDVVPRLFEAVGLAMTIHTVEGLPLIALPPTTLSRSSRLMKRAIDIFAAALLLLLTAPLFAIIAWLIRRDSSGPVFFRQERLGMHMDKFTMLKFRTMHAGTDNREHQEFIKATMSSLSQPSANGIYKLDRADAVTAVGRFLRRSNLDELPQLVNVLRGEMSLVGPRPCLEYEVEHFAPHHFGRFLVPAGLTGLWQVTARAHASFGEALDLDVAYVRSWSLTLDLSLLLRTIGQLAHRGGTA